jgi:hypothetical protein
MDEAPGKKSNSAPGIYHNFPGIRRRIYPFKDKATQINVLRIATRINVAKDSPHTLAGRHGYAPITAGSAGCHPSRIVPPIGHTR